MTKSTPSESPPTHAGGTPQRRRWPRRLLFGGIILAVLLLGLILLIPTFLSTGPGNRWVMDIASDTVQGRITADELSLAWFGGQSIEGLTIVDPDGKPVITIDTIDLPGLSLWGLATGDRSLGQITVTGVRGTIVNDAEGRTNLQAALESTNAASEGITTPPPVPVGPAASDSDSGVPLDLSLTLAMRDMQLTYEQPETDRVTVVVSTLDVDIAGLHDIAIQTRATLALGEDQGSLSLDAKLYDAVNTAGQIDTTAASVNADGQLTAIPIGAIDRIARQDGKLVALLGPTLDATLTATGDMNHSTLKLTAKAQHVDINAGFVLSPDAIIADNQSTAKLNLTPHAWALFTDEASKLIEPITISADLYRLNVPRASNASAIPDAAAELMVSISDATLVTPQVGRVGFSGTKIVVQTDRLATSAIFNLASRATVQSRTGSVSIDGDLQQLMNDAGELNLAGIVANVTGKTRDFPVIVLADGLAGQDGKLIDAIGPTLDADFTARWQDNAGIMNLTTAVQSPSGRADITSNNRFARANSEADITLTSTDTTITNLPVALVETLGEAQGKLSTLLGPKLDRITVNVMGDPRSESTFKFVMTSPRLNADVGGTYRADGVTLDPASGGSLIVSPEAFAAYLAQSDGRQADPLRLVDPLVVAMSLSHATVALPFNPSKVDIEAAAALSTFVVERNGGTRVRMEEVSLRVATANLRDKLTLNLTGRVGQDDSSTTSGDLRSATVITGLYNDEDAIDPAHLSLDTDTALTGFPIDLLDRLGGYDGQLVAMLGDNADVTAKGAMPGNLNLKLQSPVITAPLALNISPEREVTLTEDFTAQMRPTEQTFDLILGKIQPILADAVSAEKPMTLTIRKDGLVVPIKDFDIAKLVVQGEVDLGQIRMDRQGWFNQALTEIFARIGESLGGTRSRKRTGATDTYLATFTPMDFDVRDGKVTTTQMWMTSKDMAVGFDTRADLVNDRLDMMMGMVGATLSAGLPAIRPAIDVSAIYDIPVRGSLSDPKPDLVPLTTGILANSAGRIGGLFGGDGGKIGDIIGKVAGVVTQSTLASSQRDWQPPAAVAAFVEEQGGNPRQIDPNYEPKTPSESEPAEQQPQDPVQEGLKLFQDLLKNL